MLSGRRIQNCLIRFSTETNCSRSREIAARKLTLSVAEYEAQSSQISWQQLLQRNTGSELASWVELSCLRQMRHCCCCCCFCCCCWRRFLSDSRQLDSSFGLSEQLVGGRVLGPRLELAGVSRIPFGSWPSSSALFSCSEAACCWALSCLQANRRRRRRKS